MIAIAGAGADVLSNTGEEIDSPADDTAWFTYLLDHPGESRIILGDARLSLERADKENFDVLDVPYHQMVHNPQMQARNVSGFLDLDLDVSAMAAAVDPALYRQRSG